MKKIGIFATLLAALVLINCGGDDKQADTKNTSGKDESSSAFPRNETFYIGGWDWSAPSTFNPLAGDPNFPIDGNLNVMYEALFGYNQMTGEMEPILAKSLEVTEDAIIVTLDEKAKWSDGTPVTTEDVAYTFGLDKDLNTPKHGNWNYLKSVTVADSNKVVFELRKDNYNPLLVKDMLSEVNILPKSVFSKLFEDSNKNLTEMLKFKNDSNVVASGPYTLYKYFPDKIILKRVEDYWGNYKYNGKKPAPKFIIHSLYNGNNIFSSSMTKGNLDMSSTYIPRIADKEKDKMRAWSKKAPYHIPGSIPTLFMPLTVAPFDDVAFRRALVHAVDFAKIKRLAVSNYTPDMQPGFILPFSSAPESKYFVKEDAEKYGYKYDLEKAKQILKDAGYSWDANGKLLDKTGKVMRPINVECPQGWSDWENTLKIIRDDLVKLGVNARERFVDYGVYDKDCKQGTFDLIMRTQTADLWPSSPWRRFNDIMSAKDWAPIGETMHSNFGRYKDEKTSKLLDALPKMSDSLEIANAYRELNKIFMQQVPVLPLMYRPTQYYQFSEKHWTNYPTEENPYAPPQNLMIGAGIRALWELKAVAQ